MPDNLGGKVDHEALKLELAARRSKLEGRINKESHLFYEGHSIQFAVVVKREGEGNFVACDEIGTRYALNEDYDVHGKTILFSPVDTK